MLELTPLQQKVLALLARSELKDKFYWSGGTLLAYKHLHHRLSQDIDFFSDEKFSHEEIIGFIGKLKQEASLEFVEEKKIYDRREFFLHNQEELRLEFVHYDHPQLKKRGAWQGITVDSLDDLAANKLMSLIGRNEPKDVVDVYFLLTQGGFEISQLLELVEKKFGVKYQESMIWGEALNSSQNLDHLKPLLLTDGKDQIIQDIKDYFEEKSDNFLDRVFAE